MGHTKATDLLQGFQARTTQPNPRQIFQISMDGPNTNLSFLSTLVKERDPDIPKLLGVWQLFSSYSSWATKQWDQEDYMDTGHDIEVNIISIG